MSITTATSLMGVAPGHDLAPVQRQPKDQNPALVYLASLSPGSRRTMRHALDTMADILLPGTPLESFPWAALRFQHTQALRSVLSERYSAATANKMLSALRQTLKRARRLGQMDPEAYAAAIDLDAVVGTKPDQAAGRALTMGELMALMNACAADDGPAGVRDAAILGLAYAGGLRRAEIAGLQVASLDRGSGVLTVHGKRNRTRTVPLANGALDALEDWLAIRGDTPGPLFVGIRRGGHLVEGSGLTDQAVYYILDKRAREGGVATFTPHDLRRTFAGDLLDAEVDISTVQKLMGHASATTTAGYDRRGERAKQEAVKRLHVPYSRVLEGILLSVAIFSSYVLNLLLLGGCVQRSPVRVDDCAILEATVLSPLRLQKVVLYKEVPVSTIGNETWVSRTT
jgi:integrase